MKEIEVNNLSDKINIRILSILNKISSNLSIGLFYPYKNEVNVLALVEKLEKMEFNCLLPKVISKNMPLKYFSYSHHSTLLEKGFGNIMEPIGGQSFDPDIIIASCSAFNVEGYRVGYGGGFFDRTISELRNKKKIITILAAFEAQKTTMQFQKNFDEKVDYICTENKTYST
jgi:5-formyltetrahydrofolate cyclo-ligase